MRHSHAAVVLLLVPALALARDEPKKEKVEEPEGLLEATAIIPVSINHNLVGFNQGRPYAISINEQLPGAKSSRAKFAKALEAQKYLDLVVFEWFGKKPPKRLNIMIGNKVPVHIAQAAIAVFAVDSNIPVYLCLMRKDEALGSTRCIYVGALVDCGEDAFKPEQLRELIKPGLSQERFAEMLTKNGK